MITTETLAWAVGIGGALGTWVVSFRWFFREPGDFSEALKHCLMPDLISLFRGEWFNDNWNELKMTLWLGLGAVVGAGAYFGIAGWPA